ncbi:undecaprenyldiphospho-muramoylpentapeptide beta-N-acetylglucosaminyltransferase [Rurimicrobium arvi]|uniref:UDP-N-acetylglucosamine--N-acetylmuramyl-(pentapeptide) pyrophosphoryl-undecaprenol N-acetylglucosamine transferase n=1 Tax=Rurimicrobium arvi TaxID=2049916 RepID=A0ABP8MFU5_9BACT
MPKKVIIAGGGTGGHIFPAVAIGHALGRHCPGVELLFVGANGKMEMEKVPQEGFRIVGLDIAGFNRSNMLKNVLLPLKLWRSMQAAGRIIREFQPDLVIGVGGYASFPILKAAQSAGVPTMIQEQNSYAGKSNKHLGRRADAICVAYDKMQQFFPADKISLTGNPVRKVISQSTVTHEQGIAFFGLQSGRRTLLVVGGSLGAKSINEAMAAHLAEIVNLGVQVVWQTGKLFFEQAKAAAAPFGDRVKVFDFIREMDEAYAVADMVVSRAGALAIAELCIVAKPVIFIPYPFAAEDHQTANAIALVEKNAALMIKDDEVRTQLPAVLKSLLADETTQRQMSDQLKRMAIRDADDRIAAIAIDLMNKRKS